MTDEDARTAAAGALRDLVHAFAAHGPDDEQYTAIAASARAAADQLRATPRRDRLALIASRASGEIMGGLGFEDRAVGGHANPTGVDIDVRFEEPDVVADLVLRQAFEGAPGRAHGGIVAAAFDDVTGFVIGRLQEPAFTGELTVRYEAPVPVNEPLEIRTRLDSRERRKLFITAEMRHNGEVIARCKAIYITVDPSRFAVAPDPR
jgi:acyl-coenzyme A thioesterase PaaI-like protein